MLRSLICFWRPTPGAWTNRYLWIRAFACMLGILLVAFSLTSVAVAADNEGKTTVTANVADVIQVVEWPDTIHALGDLEPGREIVIGPLHFEVLSNVPWEIQIASDSQYGELREFSSTGNHYLMDAASTTNSLRWRLGEAGAWTSLSDLGVSLFGDQDPTGDTSKKFDFYLGFLPSFNDVRLTDPDREYRIILTYTVGVRY